MWESDQKTPFPGPPGATALQGGSQDLTFSLDRIFPSPHLSAWQGGPTLFFPSQAYYTDSQETWWVKWGYSRTLLVLKHQRHPRACQKCRTRGPNPYLLSQHLHLTGSLGNHRHCTVPAWWSHPPPSSIRVSFFFSQYVSSHQCRRQAISFLFWITKRDSKGLWRQPSLRSPISKNSDKKLLL